MRREQQRCRGDGLHRPVSQVIGLNDSLTGPAQTLPRRHTSITVTPHTHTTPPLSTGLPHGSRSSRDVRDTHPSIHPQTELITFAAGLQPAMGSSNPATTTTIKTMMNQHYNNYNSHHYNFCCCTSTTTTSKRSRTNVPVSLEPVARPVTCIPHGIRHCIQRQAVPVSLGVRRG